MLLPYDVTGHIKGYPSFVFLNINGSTICKYEVSWMLLELSPLDLWDSI